MLHIAGSWCGKRGLTCRSQRRRRCSRILNACLRPWTLLRALASPHASYLADLDIVLISVLNRRKRCRSKRAVGTVLGVQRSLTAAWDNYRKHHIVSQDALQLIRSFLLTQMPESVGADADEDAENGRQSVAKVFSP